MAKLRGHCRLVDDLSAELLARMHQLMQTYYVGCDFRTFCHDLAEKDYVLTFEDPHTGALRGFSTAMVYHMAFRGEPVRVVFSGDTIIAHDSWGSMELPALFGQMVLGIGEWEPKMPVYWLLISKGFRTYRFLPVFFDEFYPRYDEATPDEIAAFMSQLARIKYEENYDSAAGVIRAPDGQHAQRLRSAFAEIPHAKLNDPHVRFFSERNDGYRQGDELVCLAEFSRENLSSFINRILDRRGGPLQVPMPPLIERSPNRLEAELHGP